MGQPSRLPLKICIAIIKEETLPENDDIDEGEDEGEHAFRQSM